MRFTRQTGRQLRETAISITLQVAALLILLRILEGYLVVDPEEHIELLADVASTHDYKKLCLLTSISPMDPNRQVTPLTGTQQTLHRRAGFDACNLVRATTTRLSVARARSLVNSPLLPDLNRADHHELVNKGCEIARGLTHSEPYARTLWSHCLFYGPAAFTKDRPEAIRQALQAAEEGSSQSLFLLAQAYQFGNWVQESASKSREYYEEAALLGNVDAEYTLSTLAHPDLKTAPPANVLDAVRDTHKRGSTLAANWLGMYYLAGHAGEEKSNEAYPYLRESAGYPASAYYIAAAYEEGKLRSDDSVADAIHFYTLAAADGNGYTRAYLKLANLLQEKGRTQFSLADSRQAMINALTNHQTTLTAAVECVSFNGIPYAATHTVRLSNQVFGNRPVDDALMQLELDFGCNLAAHQISTLRSALQQANAENIGFIEYISQNRDTLQTSVNKAHDH